MTSTDQNDQYDYGGVISLTEWVNADKLEGILGEALDKTSWISESELRNRSREGQVLEVLTSKGRYIVVLDENRRFEKEGLTSLVSQ